MDSLGKVIQDHSPNTAVFQLDGEWVESGLYFVKLQMV
jgi:hypothetical protein